MKLNLLVLVLFRIFAVSFIIVRFVVSGFIVRIGFAFTIGEGYADV
jgi:hypothetical protein